jgi:hypothetical protein
MQLKNVNFFWNLRKIEWVCLFLNPPNYDKLKKQIFDDDQPTQWTREIFDHALNM